MFGKYLFLMLSAAIGLGSSVRPQPPSTATVAREWNGSRTVAVARIRASGGHSTATAGRPTRTGRALLPDSVLVRIAGGRDIVRSFAIRRWSEQVGASGTDSITPAAARGFLDLLIDEAVLTSAAVRESAAWSPEDSATHRALHDRLVLAVALDSVLDTVRSHTAADTALDAQALGTLARERVVGGLAPAYDDSALARVAREFAALPRPSPDSSLAVQMRVLQRLPRFAAADSNAVLARASVGDVRAAEVIAAWARLSFAYRPRIDTAEQVRDLAANQLFERVLRAAAARGGFDGDSRVTGPLTLHAEQIARGGYLEREVLTAVDADSASIDTFWRAHLREWALPVRVRGIRLVLDDRAAAVGAGAMLANAAQAESLAVRAARGGANYRFETGAGGDSSLFRRALQAGPGAIVGPVALDGAWWVARVTDVLPGRPRRLEEVRDEVTQRVFALEAERRVRALAARLRQTLRVELRPGAAEELRDALREIAQNAARAGAR